MRRSILLALTLTAGVVGLAGPAAAQFSRGDVPSWERDNPPPPPPYYRPPRPGYPPPPQYGYRPPPPPPYYGRPGYGYGYAAPRNYSNICITGRGNCSSGRPLPAGAPCSCFIPGFGTKRGAIASY
jgi:hypothetical protein